MSVPTRYQQWSQPILVGRLGYAEPEEPEEDPADPTDYASLAQGAAVQVAIDIGSVAKVQEASGTAGIVDSYVAATFASPPEEGHLLLAVFGYRGTSTSHSDPSGWTKRSDVQGPSFDGGRLIFYTKVAGPTESSTVAISTSAHNKALYIAEWSGLNEFDSDVETDSHSASSSLTTAALTPTTDGGVLFCGFNASSRNPSIAIDAPFTEDYDRDIDASGPSVVFGHMIEASFAGPYTATATSNQSDGYGAFLAAFEGAGAVWTPGPGANDEDDATYAESDALIDGACLRIALSVDRQIYRAELLMGTETAGSRTYSIYGSSDAEFTAPDLLDSVTFAATGSYTADEVVFSWIPTAVYTYYEIRGDAETRRIYDLKMFSATSTVGVTDHPALTGREDPEQHPADAVSYDPTSSGLTATDVQAAIDEVAGGALDWAETGDIAAEASGSTADGGVLNEVARGDHRHAMPTLYSDPLTTRGDLLRRGASSSDRYAIGTAGHALVSDGTDPAWTAQYAAISVVIDGGGSAITTGVKGDIRVPFACTIVRATLLADQSGSIVVDVWKDTYANYPPTVADSITASAKPTISSATKSEDTTLTGWTTAIAEGSTLRFNVDSASTVTRVTLELRVRRT